MDSNLKWKKHINYVVLIATFFFIFKNIRDILDKKYLKIIYLSFV